MTFLVLPSSRTAQLLSASARAVDDIYSSNLAEACLAFPSSAEIASQTIAGNRPCSLDDILIIRLVKVRPVLDAHVW